MNFNKDTEKWIKRFIILLFVMILYYFLRETGIVKGIFDIINALTPLYIAVFISWLMKPLANMLSTKLRIPYALSCFISILLNVIIVLSIIFIVIPTILVQLVTFLSGLGVVLKSLFQELERFGIIDPNINLFDQVNNYLTSMGISLESVINTGFETVKDNGITWINSIISGFGGVIGIFSQIMFGYLLAFYLMPDFQKYLNLLISKFSDNKKGEATEILKAISNTLRGYVKGLFLDTTILFVIMTISVYVIFGSGLIFETKMPIQSVLAFSLIAALFNVIPYVGPMIGGIPLVLVTFSTAGITGMVVAIILISVVQFIESNFIAPRVVGNAVSLRPLTIIIGLLLFSTLFGFVGMFISTPAIATIKIFLVKFKVLGEDDI